LDNKISELAEDNIENIKLELDELEDKELNELFDINLDLDDDIDFDNINDKDDEKKDKSKTVVCPNCGEEFII